MHHRWLGKLTLAHLAHHLAHEEMLQRIERAEALCDRLKRLIAELVPQWSPAPVVLAIQALRGVSLVVASAIVAQVGSDHPGWQRVGSRPDRRVPGSSSKKRSNRPSLEHLQNASRSNRLLETVLSRPPDNPLRML